jgi:hypothetical protein
MQLPAQQGAVAAAQVAVLHRGMVPQILAAVAAAVAVALVLAALA